MNILDFITPEDVLMDYIAEVYAKNKLNLLHGPQGSGKSYSVIKSLNQVGITPYYVAVEHTGGLQSLNKHYLDSSILNPLLHEKLLDNDLTEDDVVIIDTYTRFAGLYLGWTELGILQILEDLCRRTNTTLIVIGHTRAFVGRDGIFDDNVTLARSCAEELFLEKSEYKATKSRDAYIDYNLHIVKGRGNGGSRIINNWMRAKEDND